MSEYSNNSVSGLSCSYARLASYNKGSNNGPAITPGSVSGKYIVPAYGAPGYNTLTAKGVPSCSGYYNINSAYGKNSGEGCSTQFVQKLCQ